VVYGLAGFRGEQELEGRFFYWRRLDMERR